MLHYLYIIENILNGKSYIGVTSNIHKRWKVHKGAKGSCPLIHNAITKYGIDNFKFKILCIGDKDYIYNLEELAITSFSTRLNGYNLAVGGVAGSTGISIPRRTDDKPIFIGEFWFPSTRIAATSLGIKSSSICRDGMFGRIRNKIGSSDDFNSRSISQKRAKSGNKNPMFGKLNNHRSVKVSINGVIYLSISDAVRNTEYTKSQIEKRLKNKIDGFSYIT